MKEIVNSLVVGSEGEIGKGLIKVLRDRYEVRGVDVKSEDPAVKRCIYLNICIPYSDKFVDIVRDYMARYSPDIVIVHSTVPVGTCKKIGKHVVHSPVMGKHPNMEKGLKTYLKFVGWDREDDMIRVRTYLGQVMRACSVKGSDTTELMKLLSLARYGLYLQVADHMDMICGFYNKDYETVVKLWETAYNEGIAKSEPDRRRPVYDPPKGKIGGHCVLQNMRLLNERVPTPLISEMVKRYENI